MNQANESMGDLSPDNSYDVFNYQSVDSFPSRYLETYYSKIDLDEKEVIKFLVEEYKKIEQGTNFLDIGCGPTVHHVLPVVEKVSSISLADYLSENLAELNRWVFEDSGAHNWNLFTEYILKQEGKHAGVNHIQIREQELRNKIQNVLYGNVLKAKPLGSIENFDNVGFYYCAEEVAISKDEWKKVMANVAGLVKSGGRFFVAALRLTDYYSIVSPNGEMQKLPTAYLHENDFSELLPQLGFSIDETVIKVVDTPEQKDFGISSIILVSTKKS